MNRTEWIALIFLIILLVLWGPLVQLFQPAKPPQTQPPQDAGQHIEEVVSRAAPQREPELLPLEETLPVETKPPVTEALAPAEPEQVSVLENDSVKISVSSHGAAIRSAVMKEYRQSLDMDSDPVVLEFKHSAALAYSDLSGLTDAHAFSVEPTNFDNTLVFTRQTPEGLELRRTLQLVDHYLVKVTDQFINRSSKDAMLASYGIKLGDMHNLEGDKLQRGVVSLGVDTLLLGGEGVKYWGKKIPKWLKGDDDAVIDQALEKSVDWVAVKNMYFAQILTPQDGAEDCLVYAEAEADDPKTVGLVAAEARFPEQVISAGDSFTRESQFYLGPKKYSELHNYGLHQVDVMEFGMWRAIGKILLVVMNWFEGHIWPHNYGVAIMILTILVRMGFWPLTHKSTESMKRMAELQPQMQEIKEKVKDPQKQQQAIMALYKENKVNPLGGCLPILVQIPVFIALFVVLRSAIELRFAEFLWIKDLSQPENLFADVLPIPLNILPLVMAITMVWQQKLSPQTGDARQQKMMATIMPVFMLFIFYKFAAGLVLYWTTNQCLMIVQLYFQKRQREKKAAAAAAQ